MTKPARKPPAIKPCPFCGGKAEVGQSVGWWIECTRCRAASGTVLGVNERNRERAIAAWNRRTPEKP